MKISKLIAISALSAAALVGTVQAQNTYHLFGSTAYRKVTFNAVQALFNEPGNSLTYIHGVNTTSGLVEDITHANLNSDSNWTAVGTLGNQGLGAVTVYADWAGSVGGLKRLTHQDTVSFYLDTASVVGSAPIWDSAVPNFAMGDNQPDITPFVSPTPGYTGVVNTPIAIVDFVVAPEVGSFPADFNNVTSYQLNQLYTGLGHMPVSLFTGNPAEQNLWVYGTGRDDDSGTRALFVADTLIGFGTTIYQYGITAGPTYTKFGLASVNANDGNGYPSGGNVATALNINNPGNYKADGTHVSYAIGYIAVTDWTQAPQTLTSLMYNGVAYSPTAVQQGQYSYWGYENANIRDTDSALDTGSINEFSAALESHQIALSNGTIPGTLSISSMSVGRNDDGQPIFPLF